LELMRGNIRGELILYRLHLDEIQAQFFKYEASKAPPQEDDPLNRERTLDELESTAQCLTACSAFLTKAKLYIDGGQND
jgi:hypothetical protein